MLITHIGYLWHLHVLPWQTVKNVFLNEASDKISKLQIILKQTNMKKKLYNLHPVNVHAINPDRRLFLIQKIF